MNALTGMEKFSHLEDKIYLTIELARKLREEKIKFEREAQSLRGAASSADLGRAELENQVASLLAEREVIQEKVDAMLMAMSQIDGDLAEAATL
ncbi:MAG: hypothetical protein WKF34_03175 [Pyrinomonadaceae bacterium]